MSVKGLLFDFNGTLFFDSEHQFYALNQCFERYGLERHSDGDMVENIFGKNNKTVFLEMFKPNATDEDVMEFDRIKEEFYRASCLRDRQNLKLCDGAAELLDYLKANSVPYCIATGSPLENVKFYFEYLGLDRWFTYDNLVYTDGTFKGKPAPDCYALAAERIGLSPSECAVFEDGTSGIKAARAAGVSRVFALWEDGLPSPLRDGMSADEIHHDLSDWKGILSRLGII